MEKTSNLKKQKKMKRIEKQVIAAPFLHILFKICTQHIMTRTLQF